MITIKIDVEVKLYPPLRKNSFTKGTITLVSPATVDTLLQYLTVKKHEVGSVYVNGKDTTFNQPLVSGSRISILPLIGGG